MKAPLFLSIALVLPVPMALAAGAKVCFEAENTASIDSPFRKVADTKAPGGRYIELPWDYNKAKGAGRVTYKFNVKTAGKYYLWARTFWEQGHGNSIKVSANDELAKILGEDGTYDTWHWVGGKARVTLKEGVNTLTLRYSETGVRVDRFCLNQEKGDYVR